jgi:hypothetical protein
MYGESPVLASVARGTAQETFYGRDEMILRDWQSNGNHVWYFSEADVIVTVDDLQHWYWAWLCESPPGAVYLGEL